MLLGFVLDPKIVKLGADIVPKIEHRLGAIFLAIWRPGNHLGLDLGAIVGSISGSRARHAIFAKSSTAPQREHDFRGPGGGGPKNK